MIEGIGLFLKHWHVVLYFYLIYVRFLRVSWNCVRRYRDFFFDTAVNTEIAGEAFPPCNLRSLIARKICKKIKKIKIDGGTCDASVARSRSVLLVRREMRAHGRFGRYSKSETAKCRPVEDLSALNQTSGLERKQGALKPPPGRTRAGPRFKGIPFYYWKTRHR